MGIDDWNYYNHAVISALEPHEVPDISCIKDGTVWRKWGRKALLARWTTDYDCTYKTSWWYVIKDDQFDINSLKSSYRYKINKGKKYFNIKKIQPSDYCDDIYKVYKEAYESWPEKYRPSFSQEDARRFTSNLSAKSNIICYGAFFRDNDELCGIIISAISKHHVDLYAQRVKPNYEKYQINAALVEYLLQDYRERLAEGNFYVCDGARAIKHETAFQDYLHKYFGFRKAYCKIHVAYKFPLNVFVKILYPFRKIISNKSSVGSMICAVLKMEECRRECNK